MVEFCKFLRFYIFSDFIDTTSVILYFRIPGENYVFCKLKGREDFGARGKANRLRAKTIKTRRTQLSLLTT